MAAPLDVQYALAKEMPPGIHVVAGDFVRTNIEPGVFKVSRELNGSFVMLETTMWVTKRENGKYKRRQEKVETHCPRSSITEIKRPINHES